MQEAQAHATYTPDVVGNYPRLTLWASVRHFRALDSSPDIVANSPRFSALPACRL